MPIEDLIKETCEDLINLHKGQKPNGCLPRTTKFLFPPDCDKSCLRVSEQEARFIFASVVERGSGFRYSVETPTKLKYKFKGKKKISAQTDLSLWEVKDEEQVFDVKKQMPRYNIEFKAHNARQSSIDKDIEKLVTEETDGVWFHLLENVNSGTFPRLAKKFEKAFLQYGKDKINGLLFAVCALKNEITILGTLTSYSKTQTDIKAFFKEGCDLLEAPSQKQVGHWVVL